MKCHMALYTNQPLKPFRTPLPFVLDFISLIDVLFGSLLTAVYNLPFVLFLNY